MSTLVVTKKGETQFRIGERVRPLMNHPTHSPETIERLRKSGVILAQSVNRPDQVWRLGLDSVSQDGPNEYTIRRLRQKLIRLQKLDKPTVKLTSANVATLLLFLEDHLDKDER